MKSKQRTNVNYRDLEPLRSGELNDRSVTPSRTLQHDISPGNKAGGLTTILEKSLGPI